MGNKIFIGLGSNLGLCSNNLQNAIAAITGHRGLHLVQSSPVYQTEPQGFKNQPWFLNQVIHLKVDGFWTPWSLLTLLKGIEVKMGRQKRAGQGPRVIDLDILVFRDRVIDEADICIPHPSMKQRAFVLVPLMDICPDFVFPDGQCLKSILDNVNFTLEENRIYQQYQHS